MIKSSKNYWTDLTEIYTKLADIPRSNIAHCRPTTVTIFSLFKMAVKDRLCDVITKHLQSFKVIINYHCVLFLQ